MSLFTVAITGIASPIEVYDGLPAVDDYLNAAIGDGATAWRALIAANDADGRKRILVSATRFIDSLGWQGNPTTPPVSSTTLQWPRTGVVIDGGTAVDPNTVPAAIQQGVEELCALIAADPSVLTQADSGSNIQSMGAGPAAMSFFRPTSLSDGNATELPTVLNRLVGRYLATAALSSALAGVASGVNSCSNFDCSTCGCSPCCCSGSRDITSPL